MGASLRRIRGVFLAPANIAIGLAWLVIVRNIIVAHTIVRETHWGGVVAQQIDRLPPLVAGLVFAALWLLFLFGWTVPVFFGVQRFLRRGDERD